jgi:hypothetical protein
MNLYKEPVFFGANTGIFPLPVLWNKNRIPRNTGIFSTGSKPWLQLLGTLIRDAPCVQSTAEVTTQNNMLKMI